MYFVTHSFINLESDYFRPMQAIVRSKYVKGGLEGPRGFQEVTVPRLRDNGPGRW